MSTVIELLSKPTDPYPAIRQRDAEAFVGLSQPGLVAATEGNESLKGLMIRMCEKMNEVNSSAFRMHKPITVFGMQFAYAYADIGDDDDGNLFGCAETLTITAEDGETAIITAIDDINPDYHGARSMDPDDDGTWPNPPYWDNQDWVSNARETRHYFKASSESLLTRLRELFLERTACGH